MSISDETKHGFAVGDEVTILSGAYRPKLLGHTQIVRITPNGKRAETADGRKWSISAGWVSDASSCVGHELGGTTAMHIRYWRADGGETPFAPCGHVLGNCFKC